MSEPDLICQQRDLLAGFRQAAELDAAWKLLQARWDATGETWTDRVHDEFAEHYWQPLEQQTQAVQCSLERLAQVIAQAQRAVK